MYWVFLSALRSVSREVRQNLTQGGWGGLRESLVDTVRVPDSSSLTLLSAGEQIKALHLEGLETKSFPNP